MLEVRIDEVSDIAPETVLDASDSEDTDEDRDLASEETESPFICPWLDASEGLSGGRVARIAFDPRVPGLAWSLSGGTLFRSIDDGLAWSETGGEVFGSLLAFPPEDVKSLIVAGDGLSISHDGGLSFEPLALSGLEITALMLDPAVPSRIWVGANALGILRSDNDGQSFAARTQGVPFSKVLSFAGFADTPDLILAGTVGLNPNLGVTDRGEILRTTDGGMSWTSVHTDARWVYDLEVCPTDESRVFAAVRDGIRISSDKGLTWGDVPSLDGFDVLDIEVEEDCETLWLSVYQRGVFRVTDEGATVHGPMALGLDLQMDRLAGQISRKPGSSDLLLLGTHAGAFRSDNGGLSWRRLAAARGLQPTRLLEAPSGLFLGTWGGGLWHLEASETLTWDKVAGLPLDYLYSVSSLSREADVLLASGTSSTWVGDELWRPTVGPVNAFDALSVRVGDGDVWLVATQVGGVLRSDDAGETWTPFNDGLTAWSTSAGPLIDARTLARLGDRVILGTRGRGLFFTDDLAPPWQPGAASGDNLADDSVTKLLVANEVLYAVIEGKGLYRSDDRGESFRAVSTGTADIRDLAFDKVSGTLFVAQGTGPILESRDGNEFMPFIAYCGDSEAPSALGILHTPEGRSLIAVHPGNRVSRAVLSP